MKITEGGRLEEREGSVIKVEFRAKNMSCGMMLTLNTCEIAHNLQCSPKGPE